VIHRVSNDHAALAVDDNAPERLIELAIIVTILAHHAHVRTIIVTQHMQPVRAVLDYNNAPAVVKSNTCGGCDAAAFR
jgi:hypothetical protein